jgi:patatin-like phospholipase/acyl hydrolase
MCAGTYAPAPFERAHTILSWLQQLIVERIADGGVTAPPPVQARIHQVLSDAMMGYEQCKYVTLHRGVEL